MLHLDRRGDHLSFVREIHHSFAAQFGSFHNTTMELEHNMDNPHDRRMCPNVYHVLPWRYKFSHRRHQSLSLLNPESSIW
jgi:hypothetical protein